MVEPLSVGVQAARKAGVCPGKSVAIMGAGPIGGGHAVDGRVRVRVLAARARRGSARAKSVAVGGPLLLSRVQDRSLDATPGVTHAMPQAEGQILGQACSWVHHVTLAGGCPS